MTRRQEPGVRALRTLIAAVVCAGLTGACGGGSSEVPRASSPDVWAVVDGREIRKDEVERAYRATVQNATASPSEDEALAAKLGIVEELITQNILLARANATGIQIADDELNKVFEERRQGTTEQDFQARLKERNLTADDLKAGIRRELSVQKVLERDVVAKVSIPDGDVTAYYDSHKPQFNVPETQFRLAQIVVTPVREPQISNRTGDDAVTPEAAKQKAQALLAKLKAGELFSTLAMDYSEDPQTAPRGGDLGFVPMSALQQAPPQLREIVMRTQPGNVSSATANGAFTIVLVASREEPGQRDLNTPAVRDGIRDMLRERKTQALRLAYLAAARDDAEVTNYLARQVVAGQPAAPPVVAPTAPAAK